MRKFYDLVDPGGSGALRKHHERVNYVVDNGRYCAHMVNLPIIVQAESLEEMKRRIKLLCQSYLHMMKECVDNDLFEYVEEKINQGTET